jgi:hypothetical protein
MKLHGVGSGKKRFLIIAKVPNELADIPNWKSLVKHQ